MKEGVREDTKKKKRKKESTIIMTRVVAVDAVKEYSEDGVEGQH